MNVYSDKDVVWCAVQTVGELVDVKFLSHMSNEEVGDEEASSGKSEPPATLLSAIEGIDTVRKCLKIFYGSDNRVVAICRTESKVDMFREK
jgi:hypothetical protein